jgi:repressor LexA
MEPLTEKQQKVLKYIEDRLEKSNPPSQREIARHFHLAQNAVFQLLTYLRKKGYLEISSGHRELRLSKEYIEKTKKPKGLPVIGTVAAGRPILAEENIEQFLDPGEILCRKAAGSFILKVTGDSMVDEGIMDGDFVVVEPASEIANGRIGVVLLNDEATVKKVYVRRKDIALEPANKAAGYKTIYVKKGGDNIRIIGKVTGCFRKL